MVYGFVRFLEISTYFGLFGFWSLTKLWESGGFPLVEKGVGKLGRKNTLVVIFWVLVFHNGVRKISRGFAGVVRRVFHKKNYF